MKSFLNKIEKIIGESKASEKKTVEEEHVKPEKGEDVTHGVIDGTGKIDATGPIKKAAHPKTSPGPTTAGPTGHIPTNSDLPYGQKKYTLGEEEDDKKKKDVEEGKLPPFMKKGEKKDDKDDDKKDGDKKKDDKKDGNPFGKKKEVKEEAKDATEETDDKDKSEEFDHEEGDKSKSVKEAKKVDEETDEKDDKKAVKEATEALFAGEQISEAFQEKTSTIFEAILSKRIREYRLLLNERYGVTLNTRVEEIRNQLTEAVYGHLDLVVESWVKDNEVPLQKAIKAELVEDFIGGLKSLLEDHYIELPDEKVDVVVEMVNRIADLEAKLNEQIDANVDLKKQTRLFERAEVFNKISKGLVATQVEKLKSLAESIEFKSSGQFETALITLKETVDVNTTQKKPGDKKLDLSEETLEQNTDAALATQNSKQMNSAIEFLGRMAKN